MNGTSTCTWNKITLDRQAISRFHSWKFYCSCSLVLSDILLLNIGGYRYVYMYASHSDLLITHKEVSLFTKPFDRRTKEFQVAFLDAVHSPQATLSDLCLPSFISSSHTNVAFVWGLGARLVCTTVFSVCRGWIT